MIEENYSEKMLQHDVVNNDEGKISEIGYRNDVNKVHGKERSKEVCVNLIQKALDQENNEKERPVVIHRAISGSLER